MEFSLADLAAHLHVRLVEDPACWGDVLRTALRGQPDLLDDREELTAWHMHLIELGRMVGMAAGMISGWQAAHEQRAADTAERITQVLESAQTRHAAAQERIDSARERRERVSQQLQGIRGAAQTG